MSNGQCPASALSEVPPTAGGICDLTDSNNFVLCLCNGWLWVGTQRCFRVLLLFCNKRFCSENGDVRPGEKASCEICIESYIFQWRHSSNTWNVTSVHCLPPAFLTFDSMFTASRCYVRCWRHDQCTDDVTNIVPMTSWPVLFYQFFYFERFLRQKLFFSLFAGELPIIMYYLLLGPTLYCFYFGAPHLAAVFVWTWRKILFLRCFYNVRFVIRSLPAGSQVSICWRRVQNTGKNE